MNTPLILGFDTSAAHCAACLLAGDNVLGLRFEEMTKGQAERLMPLLEELLAEAGKSWSDLDGIGVGTGPGNFTGIRISVAAARGLALSLGIEAIGVSALEAQVHGLGQNWVISCLDARQNKAYVQLFAHGEADAPQLRALTYHDLPQIHPKADGVVTGSFADPVGEILNLRTVEPAMPLTEAIARIALPRLGTDQPRPAPLYIRAPDAAPPRDPAPVILD